VFQVGPNDERVVNQIWPTGFLSGRPISFNENFTLAFILVFADGSEGIYTASLVALPGDYDDNGIVDAGDYNVWRKSLGQTGTGLPADGNNNGAIDPGDFTIWRNNYGKTAGTGTSLGAVPEPTSLFLMLATWVSLAVCPRRTARRS
jgi:hypothetical protein